MWPFTPRKPAPDAPASLNDALRLFLVEKVEMEAKLEGARAQTRLANVEAEAKLARELIEARAAARERRRAATKLKKRGGHGRFLPDSNGSGCQLCSNPNMPHPTIEMIDAHRQHGSLS